MALANKRPRLRLDRCINSQLLGAAQTSNFLRAFLGVTESSDYTVSSANAFDFDHGCAFTAAIRLIEPLGDDSIQAYGAQFAHPVFCLVSIVRGWGKAKHAFCGQVFYRQIMEKFL